VDLRRGQFKGGVKPSECTCSRCLEILRPENAPVHVPYTQPGHHRRLDAEIYDLAEGPSDRPEVDRLSFLVGHGRPVAGLLAMCHKPEFLPFRCQTMESINLSFRSDVCSIREQCGAASAVQLAPRTARASA